MMVRQLALVFLDFDGGDYGMDCVVVVDVCIFGSDIDKDFAMVWSIGVYVGTGCGLYRNLDRLRE